MFLLVELLLIPSSDSYVWGFYFFILGHVTKVMIPCLLWSSVSVLYVSFSGFSTSYLSLVPALLWRFASLCGFLVLVFTFYSYPPPSLVIICPFPFSFTHLCLISSPCWVWIYISAFSLSAVKLSVSIPHTFFLEPMTCFFLNILPVFCYYICVLSPI